MCSPGFVTGEAPNTSRSKYSLLNLRIKLHHSNQNTKEKTLKFISYLPDLRDSYSEAFGILILLYTSFPKCSTATTTTEPTPIPLATSHPVSQKVLLTCTILIASKTVVLGSGVKTRYLTFPASAAATPLYGIIGQQESYSAAIRRRQMSSARKTEPEITLTAFFQTGVSSMYWFRSMRRA